MKQRHTAIPWSLGDFDWRVIVGADTRFQVQLKDSGRRETDGSPLVGASNSLATIAVIEESVNHDEDLANAHFIVRAVNSHEKLIEALRTVETALFKHSSAGVITGSREQQTPVDNKQHPWIPGAEAWPVVETVRAALALADAGAVATERIEA